jgi:phospholipase/carboxylesterase
VPVQSNTQLITFKNWTLRIRPATVKAPRLLVLIHGLTGDENSMWVFVRKFPEDYWIIAPRAPHRAEHPDGGFSWWPRQAGSSGTQDEAQENSNVVDIRPVAEALISMIDEYATDNKIQARQFDVIGFSQGGVLANTIALLHPERIYRTGILASFIPANAEILMRGRPLNGKPYFVAHGRLDEKVKIEYARQSLEMLEKAGADITFCEDEVGHKVSAPCLRALEDFFTN